MHDSKWIRKWLALALTVVMLAGALPLGALAESFSAKVAVSGTKVYKNADLTGESADIAMGTEVTVQSHENGIAKISRNGYVGYISLDALSRTELEENESETEESRDETVVIKTGLRVYYKASTSADYYDTPAGSEIVILSENSNGWLKLERKGVTAYVQKAALQDAIDGIEPEVTPAPTPDVEYQAEIKLSSASSTLKIRKSKSTSAKSLGKLKHGDIVDVLAEDGKWAKISANGVTGYVQVKYLKEIETGPEATPAPEQVNYQAKIELSSASSTLNIRKTMSTKAKSLGKLKHGAVVTVVEIDGSWAKITANGVTGYVQIKYLTDLPKEEATPEPTVQPTEQPQAALYQTTVKLSSSSSYLNIRKSKNSSAKSLGKVKHGAEVAVLENDGKWSKISADGVTGYVLNKYLVQIVEETPAPEYTVVPCTVTADKLVIYKKASTKADVLKTLVKGDTIDRLDVSGNWAMVQIDGVVAYALKGGITPTVDLQPTNPPVEGVKFTATVIAGTMNVYETANAKSAVVATAALGKTVNVHEGGDKWAYISVDGVYGYAQVTNMSARKQDTYKSGDSGSGVEKLNKQLLELGYYDAVPGSNYDSTTVSAVKRLQNVLGLSENGEVDITLARVLKEAEAPSSPLLNLTMKKGDTGSNVQRLQTRLYALGYLSKSSSVDSDFGLTTQTAVKLFQKAAGLSQDGTAGGNTLKKLYSVNAPTLPKGTNPADQLSTAADDPGSTDNSALSESGQKKVEIAIEYAKSKLGCKYVYGAEGPNTFDCSGLTQTAFAQVGVKLARSAYSVGYGAAGEKIAYAGLVRGDIVCFDTVSDTDLVDHVGIYLGSGKFIHASSGKGQVIISTMSSGYYNRVFSWGKRFIN